MNNRIYRIVTGLALGLLVFAGCTDKEAELLTPKLYFENSETMIDIEDEATLTLELKSRLSTMVDSDVNVSYVIEDESVVEAYNAKFGKEYKAMTTAILESETSSVLAGGLYSENVGIQLNGLDEILGGDIYLLPVRVHTDDVPVIDGEDITYFVIRKPVKITKVARFSNSHLKIPISPLNVFTDVTYEAVVCVNSFGDNNTVMGCEGVMIMRIGDAGGGTVPRDILQVAGKSEVTWTGNPLSRGKWYHLAFSCAADGTANLYVNGEVVIPNASFEMSADLTAGNADFGFSIGKVPNFMWGSRPFNGWMTEVRLWDVVRTPSQIKENMLSVDPKSPGLVAYYKFNGDEKDSSPNERHPSDYTIYSYDSLSKPVAIGADKD